MGIKVLWIVCLVLWRCCSQNAAIVHLQNNDGSEVILVNLSEEEVHHGIKMTKSQKNSTKCLCQNFPFSWFSWKLEVTGLSCSEGDFQSDNNQMVERRRRTVLPLWEYLPIPAGYFHSAKGVTVHILPYMHHYVSAVSSFFSFMASCFVWVLTRVIIHLTKKLKTDNKHWV